ncbi:MAG: hypothetical protein WC413_03695 [Candidatus Nanoarchaeia archaeon]
MIKLKKKSYLILLLVFVLLIIILVFIGLNITNWTIKKELIDKLDQQTLPLEYGIHYSSGQGGKWNSSHEKYQFEVNNEKIEFFNSIKYARGMTYYNCFQSIEKGISECKCQTNKETLIKNGTEIQTIKIMNECGDHKVNLNEVLTISELTKKLKEEVSNWKKIEKLDNCFKINPKEPHYECFKPEPYEYELCFDENFIIRYVKLDPCSVWNTPTIWKIMPLPIEKMSKEDFFDEKEYMFEEEYIK